MDKFQNYRSKTKILLSRALDEAGDNNKLRRSTVVAFRQKGDSISAKYLANGETERAREIDELIGEVIADLAPDVAFDLKTNKISANPMEEAMSEDPATKNLQEPSEAGVTSGKYPGFWRGFITGAILVTLGAVGVWVSTNEPFINGIVIPAEDVKKAELVLREAVEAMREIETQVKADLPDDHPVSLKVNKWVHWREAFPDVYDDLSLDARRFATPLVRKNAEGGYKVSYNHPYCTVARQAYPELIEPVRGELLGEMICNAISLHNEGGVGF